MSRESEIASLLAADATIASLLTGGIWTDQEIGVEGIRRGEDSLTNSAFDPTTGILRPCAVVRERGINSYQAGRSHKGKVALLRQVVEIYYYEFRGHDVIDPAKERAYYVLEGVRLTATYPLVWDMETAHYPDVGPVANSTTVRQDWNVYSVRSEG